MSARVGEQRLSALGRANDVRLAKAERKRELKALPPAESALAVAALFQERPRWLRTETVWGVMSWANGFGPARIRRVLRDISGVREHKSLGALTDRQAEELAEAISWHGAAVRRPRREPPTGAGSARGG